MVETAASILGFGTIVAVALTVLLVFGKPVFGWRGVAQELGLHYSRSRRNREMIWGELQDYAVRAERRDDRWHHFQLDFDPPLEVPLYIGLAADVPPRGKWRGHRVLTGDGGFDRLIQVESETPEAARNMLDAELRRLLERFFLDHVRAEVKPAGIRVKSSLGSEPNFAIVVFQRMVDLARVLEASAAKVLTDAQPLPAQKLPSDHPTAGVTSLEAGSAEGRPQDPK